jgi:hypothetical protein
MRVVMSGLIVPDDVNAFKEWLVREPYTHIVQINSPGGSIDAAIAIGRLIRARFMQAWSEELRPIGERGCSYREALETQQWFKLPIDDDSIKKRQEICLRQTDCQFENRCCLSACVLVLAGGVERLVGNIGLHRPSIKDFADRSYEDARTALSKGIDLIERYLKEMEVPSGVFTTMMQVPADSVLLLDAPAATALFTGLTRDEARVVFYPPDRLSDRDYNILRQVEARHPEPRAMTIPPSVYDWLRPKCEFGVNSCFEMNKESVRRANRQSP